MGAAFVGHRGTSSPRRGRGEEGETLVELTVTTVLLGLGIVALLTATITVIVSSSASKRRSIAGNEATTVVEAVQLADYVACAGTNSYAGALSGVPAPGFQGTIVSVEHLQDADAAAAVFGPSCPGAGDQGVQRVTVSLVSIAGTRVEQEVTFVKRRDACPAAIVTVPGERC